MINDEEYWRGLPAAAKEAAETNELASLKDQLVVAVEVYNTATEVKLRYTKYHETLSSADLAAARSSRNRLFELLDGSFDLSQTALTRKEQLKREGAEEYASKLFGPLIEVTHEALSNTERSEGNTEQREDKEEG